MVSDIPDDLADLLLIWWAGDRAQALRQLGMPSECPSTRGYRSAAVWDDGGETADAGNRRLIMRTVGDAVDGLPGQQRAAIHVAARNLATGCAVWSSVRLPADREARAQLLREACSALMSALRLDISA